MDVNLSLREICDALGDVKYRWFEIGVQLGVPYNVLEEFKKKDDPLAAAINYWLKGNVEDAELCWKSIIAALNSSHVREHGLAGTLSEKYCPQKAGSAKEDKGANPHAGSVAASKISTNTSSGSSSQLSEVELQSYFPYLKDEGLPETEKLRNLARLYDEYEDVRTKFANLVHDFQQSLEKSTYKLEDVINYIKYYFHDQLPEVEELLSPCKTYSDVFGRIRRYTSFFNIGVIKPLIKKFGSPAIEKKLKKYKKKFHDYCKHRICECPRNAFGDDNERTDKIYVLKTELEMTDDLKKLEIAMNRIFLGKTFLRLLHIEEGCVKLTFRVLVGLSSNLTEGQQQSLRDNGVLRISCGDQQYDLSHFNLTKMLAKPGKISGDSAYVSASATQSVTTITDDLNPAEELLKSAEPISVDSRTDLHDIIMQDINMLKVAIKTKEYNPLSKDVYGYTALHIAAKYGKLEVMKYLIEEEGLNQSISGPQGATPLNVAAEAGKLSIVKYLIEYQHVDLSTDMDQDGHLPLHSACLGNNLMMVKYLFQKMKEVSYMESSDILNDFTKHDIAPLHIAALHGHLDIVKFFIEECECDPNLSNKAGRTALFLACENGHLEVVQYLIEVCHCPPSATDKRGNTPLHLAAQHGSLSIIQYLIEEKGYDAKCKNSQGNTPLLEASFAGMLSIVKFLIKIGCDPKTRDNENGYNCLHAACRHGNLSIIQYLIEEQHMDPNTPTRNTKSNSLHIATTYGHKPTVQYLIEVRKVDTESRDENDYTPFHLAVIHEHNGIIDIFMDQKCSPLVSNSRHETPLSLAKAMDNIPKCFRVPISESSDLLTKFYIQLMALGRLDVIKKNKNKMLNHVTSLNKNVYLKPLLHHAVALGNLDFVKYFIEEGIYEADCRDILMETPLHIAAFQGQIEIFQCLVREFHCDLMCRSSTDVLGSTPLHHAVTNDQLAMVQHILESGYGIDPEVETSCGLTPLSLAVLTGKLDIVRYLIDKHKCNIFHKGRYILHDTVKEGRSQMVKYLINDQLCDPLTEDNEGRTPFHIASSCGQLEILIYYITELKININIGNGKEEATALHGAAYFGQLQVVKYLTKLPGCNCSSIDAKERTPLHYAAHSGKIEIVKYLALTAKCNHMDKDIFGNLALHLAAIHGHFEVTKFLIEELHTPPALKNVFNDTPLHIALVRGHSKLALYLIIVLYNECSHM